MLPHTHFLVGLIFGLIGIRLGLFNLWFAFLIAILSVLIDIDHLISYYKHKKKINLKECWNHTFQEHKRWHEWTFIHHWPTFLIITFFLLIFSTINFKLSYIVFAIYVPHFLIDHLHISIEHRKRDHKHKLIRGWLIPISYLEIIINLICLIILYVLLYIV